MENTSVNRIAFEVELDPERFRSSPNSPGVGNGGDPGRLSLVHPEVSHDNLDWIRFTPGTYTSPYYTDTGTMDEELEGTFQREGTHFYHKESSCERYPNHRTYAINENTFFAVYNSAPN